ASFHGARSHVSISSVVRRITGIAFGWIGFTTAFGSVVRNAKISTSTGPSFFFLTPFQLVHIPAKANSGFSSFRANQCSGLRLVFGSGSCPYSENDVAGTTQRLSTPCQRRQWGEVRFRIFVTPLSASPFTYIGGVGMPQRRRASSGSPI